MKTYLVGGAVRDKLLGLDTLDRDWVVVGATPQEMLDKGFRQVGKDFPVFLHPETGEEYALARTERKTAKGYGGFTTHAAPDVTLEEDLLRRDLTINAIAMTESGEFVDPYGGKQDLENRVLRHVSPAFIEDPLRILRLARFAARFSEHNFLIAAETQVLLYKMVREGELDYLVPDRVWQEFEKVLASKHPQIFFHILRKFGALKTIFPELDTCFGTPNPPKHHPEIDTGIHILMVLEQAARLSDNSIVRFLALTHDLGKGVTRESEWPRHRGHEESGVPPIEAFCERYPVPKEYRHMAVITARNHINAHRCQEMTAKKVLDLFEVLDLFRKPERLEIFLLACMSDVRGRTGMEDIVYSQKEFLETAFAAAQGVDVQAIIEGGFKGEKIKEQLRKHRITAIKQL